MLNGLTDYAVLHRLAKIRAGEKILATSAAGGLGTLLVQLANQAGLEGNGSASIGKQALVKELAPRPSITRPSLSNHCCRAIYESEWFRLVVENDEMVRFTLACAPSQRSLDEISDWSWQSGQIPGKANLFFYILNNIQPARTESDVQMPSSGNPKGESEALSRVSVEGYP
jgi:hypothetical protein